MITYMFYFHLFVLIFLVLIIFLYTSSLLNNIIYKVPQVSTFNSDLDILKQVFNKYYINWKKMADLWSWTWKMLRLFEKEYEMNATWFEIDFWNVLISKIISKSLGLKNKSIKQNYFQADLKGFDFVYIYMFPCLMKRVEEKIWSSCEKWTIIFVNAFKFENQQPIEVFRKNWKDKIFVYEV
jgi:hypothetical protein